MKWSIEVTKKGFVMCSPSPKNMADNKQASSPISGYKMLLTSGLNSSGVTNVCNFKAFVDDCEQMELPTWRSLSLGSVWTLSSSWSWERQDSVWLCWREKTRRWRRTQLCKTHWWLWLKPVWHLCAEHMAPHFWKVKSNKLANTDSEYISKVSWFLLLLWFTWSVDPQ